MTELVLLPHPGFARMFPENAAAVLTAELDALGLPLSAPPEPCRTAGVDAWRLTLEAEEPALSALARSAAFFAAFAVEGALLRPLELPVWQLLPDTLPALLKYQGKTNERFTRLLCNLADGARTPSARPRVTLFDPMCGQGTSLFEAAVRGWDAVGIEVLEPPARKGAEYFVRFLETERRKHKKTEERRSSGGRKIAGLTEIRWAADRAAWETPETRRLRIFRADGRLADTLLTHNEADLLVCDLPYGVQHGARDDGGYRDVTELVRACLPGWKACLRPGAGVAISYNALTVRRDRLCAALAEQGFEVQETLSDGTLCHRVDQAITRDVAVAVRR